MVGGCTAKAKKDWANVTMEYAQSMETQKVPTITDGFDAETRYIPPTFDESMLLLYSYSASNQITVPTARCRK